MSEQGIVKWYSLARGYGFIRRDGDGVDVFVHHSEVPDDSLHEGDRVRFELADTATRSVVPSIDSVFVSATSISRATEVEIDWVSLVLSVST